MTVEKLIAKNADPDLVKGRCSCDPLLGKPISNIQADQSQNEASGSDPVSMGSQQESIPQTTPSEIQVQLHVNPHTSEAAESWEQLQDVSNIGYRNDGVIVSSSFPAVQSSQLL